ncbi:MAG: hypothetical protein KF701_04215 [Anaerolineales bacterium]|nr:MAG: hypothetical protein KF701_04215 [Anaerolineales bacterium]
MKSLSPSKQLFASLATYAALLVLSLIAANLFPQFRLPIILVPLIPGFLIVLSMLAAIRSMDEMQRRIQLEALGFAFAGMFMLLVTESLLAGARGPQPPLGPGAYLLYMAMMWAVGLLVARRKYA